MLICAHGMGGVYVPRYPVGQEVSRHMFNALYEVMELVTDQHERRDGLDGPTGGSFNRQIFDRGILDQLKTIAGALSQAFEVSWPSQCLPSR